MTIDLDALENLADEATPGPWSTCVRMGGDAIVDAPSRPVARVDYRRDLNDRDRDAAFIAAANPATIKALIAELKEARAIIKPLADCEIIEPDLPLADDITARYFFSMGEIRAARAFLARNGKGEG